MVFCFGKDYCKSCSLKGRRFSFEHKKKLSESKIGIKNPQFGKTRDKSPSWNSQLTEKDRTDKRYILEFGIWSKSVKERDNFTCKIRGDSRGGNLVSHHLYNWAKYANKRYDINNGITIRKDIHELFHIIYGAKNNTPVQFEEFTFYIKGVLL